jgi:hypothetical protein
MNKEQFKKSISEIINYYLGQIVQANMAAKEAQEIENESLFNMIQAQAQTASYAFEQGLDALLNEAFPEVEEEDSEVENEG